MDETPKDSEAEDTNNFVNQTDFEKYYTVFQGSSEEDVVYAKAFWNSLVLQPPLESRLVSADTKQRLKVTQGSSPSKKLSEASTRSRIDEMYQKAYQQEMQEERQKYMAMALRRDKIMALLRKQREERIKKEIISHPHQPRRAEQAVRVPVAPPEDLEQDIQDVRALKS